MNIDLLNERINLINAMDRLILDRYNFENEMYDFLINTIEIDTDNSFWDPVKVTLNNIDNIENVKVDLSECIICNSNQTHFKKVSCCNNLICNNCATNWFLNESFYCPYCKFDQRN